MKANFLAAFALAVLMMSATAAAQEVDSVILTTRTHYPDTIVAGAVGNHLGAPVFVTSQDRVDSEILSEIEDLSPDTVYIVGGPEAITEEVQETLAEDHDVVRIWGMTRYGTAAELAEYFWESSEKVMLVWDVLGLADTGNYEMLAEVRDLAIQEDVPVLLIRKNSVPEEVVDSLVNLSVESVILAGNVGDGVTDTLDELGVDVDEHIRGTDVRETLRELRERVREKVRERLDRHLVVVASGNWSDTIKAPYITNGSVRHITSENQIGDLIDETGEMDYDSIKIVGRPDLAQIVHDELDEAGIEADLVSGRAVAAASVALMKRDMSRIRKRAAAMKQRLADMYQRRVRSMEAENDRLVQRTEMFIQNSGLSEDVKQRWLSWLSEKKDSFDQNLDEGNYLQAFRDHSAIKTKIADLTYKYRTRLAESYRELRQKETQLRSAVADRLQQLRSVRERLVAANQ